MCSFLIRAILLIRGPSRFSARILQISRMMDSERVIMGEGGDRQFARLRIHVLILVLGWAQDRRALPSTLRHSPADCFF